jgi:hypothetical protein
MSAGISPAATPTSAEYGPAFRLRLLPPALA